MLKIIQFLNREQFHFDVLFGARLGTRRPTGSAYKHPTCRPNIAHHPEEGFDILHIDPSVAQLGIIDDAARQIVIPARIDKNINLTRYPADSPT